MISKRRPDRLTNRQIDAFHFPPEIIAAPHTDRHTGGLFGKIPGHLFQSGTAGLWTPAIQLMSLCESINLSTKPYFVGQKAFNIAAKKRKKNKKKKTTAPHISPVSERKRPRVRLKRENCYHYRGKAKKVQNRKENSPWEGIIKMIIFLPDTAAPLHYQNWSCL